MDSTPNAYARLPTEPKACRWDRVGFGVGAVACDAEHSMAQWTGHLPSLAAWPASDSHGLEHPDESSHRVESLLLP